MSVSTRSLAFAATATLAILLISTYLLTRKSEREAFAACRATKISGTATIGGPFTLTDENGRTVSERDVLSKPALVYFGYTYCPDVCPTDMARNAEAVDVLEEQGYEVTPVFISVDPKRDTPEVLKEWTDYMHPRMIGLTGTEDQVRAVAKEYKTFYQTPDAPADDNYLVDHMTQTYLMIPGVGYADFFGREETADAIAARTACFLQAADGAKS